MLSIVRRKLSKVGRMPTKWPYANEVVEGQRSGRMPTKWSKANEVVEGQRSGQRPTKWSKANEVAVLRFAERLPPKEAGPVWPRWPSTKCPLGRFKGCKVRQMRRPSGARSQANEALQTHFAPFRRAAVRAGPSGLADFVALCAVS